KKLEERCEKCGEIDDNSVVFFDVFHKNEAV
ncbi:MAG: toxin, partial [Desulfuromonas sp.]